MSTSTYTKTQKKSVSPYFFILKPFSIYLYLRQSMETIFDIHDEIIQRKHFEAITKNEWLSGSVRQIVEFV
jgi:hypothetical protein